jgi:hypothetical protein
MSRQGAGGNPAGSPPIDVVDRMISISWLIDSNSLARET